MSNTAATLSKRIRELTGWSQAELAEQLFVTRNYISLIEGAKKTASARLLNALHQKLGEVEQGNISKANKGNLSVREPQAPYGDAKLIKRQLQELFADLLALADDQPTRLGWVLEQMRSKVRPPDHWAAEMHDEILRDLLDEEKAKAAADKKTSSQSSSGKAHGGAGA